ncbi:MAG TPA: Mu-like prophage major head subunit gpT family protein [Polyangiaceae bacterium]|nr:Mu-like prophage major head subunit gpT family protein [Polyangiaceae bacterium]
MDPTPANLFALQVSVSMAFDRGVERAEPWWQKIATDVTSTTTKNIFPWEEMLPDYRLWVGERRVHRPVVRSQELINQDYEDTTAIPANALADDNLGIYRPRVERLGEAGSNLWNRLVVDAIKASLTATVYDGQFMFDTDHPYNLESPGAGTMSNKITTALSLTAFRAARATMKGYRQANGRNYMVKPNLLVVGPSNEDKALDILKADLVEVGSQGAAVTNVVKNSADVLVIPELEEISATVWMLLDTNGPLKPFIVQRRQEPVVVVKDALTDDNRFWRNEIVVGGHARGAAGYGPWYKALYSTGTT